MSALRRRYGSTPLHLVLHLALLAATAWVGLQLAEARGVRDVVVWFALALVLHDIVFLPLYTLLDRIARRGVPRSAVNHVRVPVAGSGVLLLLFFPAILGCNAESFARVAGEEPSGYLGRWLLVTALLCAASAVLYAVRGRRSAVAASAS